MITTIENRNQKPCIVCGGHGPLSMLTDGKLTGMPNVEKLVI
jgi:hypothetical protein